MAKYPGFASERVRSDRNISSRLLLLVLLKVNNMGDNVYFILTLLVAAQEAGALLFLQDSYVLCNVR